MRTYDQLKGEFPIPDNCTDIQKKEITDKYIGLEYEIIGEIGNIGEIPSHNLHRIFLNTNDTNNIQVYFEKEDLIDKKLNTLFKGDKVLVIGKLFLLYQCTNAFSHNAEIICHFNLISIVKQISTPRPEQNDKSSEPNKG